MTLVRCIVLPGMDGTGELLGEFIAAMAPDFDAQVIAYPRDRVLGYEELVEFVIPQLPASGPWLLLGESFSGAVAIRIAAQRPAGLRGLVLCASFAQPPRPPGSPLSAHALSRLASYLPLGRIPARWAAHAMLGRWRSAQWIARLQPVLASLNPAVMRHRMLEAGRVDASSALAESVCPLLYLRATRDRLVSGDSLRWIQSVRPDVSSVELDAPHFVLQVGADEAARAIANWWSGIGEE
ncbi:MAG: alpha/beta fold hydrolase [Lysobacter sp.]